MQLKSPWSFPRRFLSALCAGALAVPLLAQTAAIQVPARQNQVPASRTAGAQTARRQSYRPPMVENLRRLQTMHQKAGTSAKASALGAYETTGNGPASFPGLQQPTYMKAMTLGTNYEMDSAVTADFNGDGRPDVAAMQSNGSLNVYLTPAQGSIIDANTPSASAPGSGSYYWFTTADMNQDGRPDVITRSGSTAYVYVNNGDGTFTTKNRRELSDPNYPDAMYWNAQVGDVTGDGIPDLVTISLAYEFDYETLQSTNYFIEQVYPGTGDGKLGPAISTYRFVHLGWIQPVVLQLSLVDMNKDGKLDLVTVLAPNDSTTVRWSNIIVQLGHGDGTFDEIPAGAENQNADSILHYNGVGNLTVTDLNNDGFPDVVYVSNDGSANGEVYVAMNKGDGTLAHPAVVVNNVTVPMLDHANVADLNSDGNPDLIVYAQGSVSIYLGRGDGTFDSNAKAQYAAGVGYYRSAQPADFDGDGIPDLVDFDQKENKIGFYKGVGDGTFRAAIAIAPEGEHNSNYGISAKGRMFSDGRTGYLAQDYSQMNADFIPDIYISGVGTDGKQSYTRAIAANILEGSGSLFLQPFTADLNGDGLDDAIFAAQGGLTVAYSNGDGTLTEPRPVSLGVTLGCALAYGDAADLNGDGIKDIVLAYQGDSFCNGPGNTPAGYFTLLSRSDGSFSPTFTPYGQSIYMVKLADFNNDGIKDLVLIDNFIGIDWNTYQYIYHFENLVVQGKGDGTFDFAKTASILPGYQVNDFVVGDFDHDGNQDATLLSGGYLDSTGNPAADYPGALLVRGNGDLTFGDPVAYDSGHTHAWGEYGDLDGDGAPELALLGVDSLTGEAVSSLVLLKNDGTGNFTVNESYQYPYNSMAAAWNPFLTVSDFNGDGSNDVIVSSSNNTIVYLNNGGAAMSLAVSAASIVKGQTLTLTAQLSSSAINTPQPVGTVSFYSDGTLLGTAELDNGVATYQTAALEAGTHTLTASYAGDSAHYATSSAASVKVYAEAATFTLGAPSGTLNVTEGSAASITLMLAANDAFQGPVTLSCSGAPAGTLCSVSPSAVALQPNGTATVTLSVLAGHITTASNRTGMHGWMALSAMGAFGFVALPFATRRRRMALAVMVLAVMAAMMAAGCGDGSSTPKPTVTNASITVTAAAGDIVKTQVVTLTITSK